MGVPFAIVIAGALIAMAVYFSGSGGGTGAVPEEVAAEPQVDPIERVQKIAAQVGIGDMEAFTTCVETNKYGAEVEADMEAAAEAGARGTPYSVVVGPNGEQAVINGAQPFATVAGLVGGMLAGTPGELTPPASPVQPVSDSDHVRGAADASIAIIEYSDFDCPFCSRFHTTMNQVLDTYPGDVQWVYRHLPLAIHPDAFSAAVASECAAEQGKFWEFADQFFAAS